jgi:hypothetical protein
MQLLQQLESSSGLLSDGSPRAKRPRLSRPIEVPSDIDHVLQIYARFVESLNMSSFLAPLVDSGDDVNRTSFSSENATRVQEFQELLWRWASVADERQASEDGCRRSDAWILSAHVLQQKIRMRMTTEQMISNATSLFGRITGDIPADDSDIKNILHPLFWKFEFKDDPEVCNFLKQLLGEREGASGSQPMEYHGRLSACIKEELTSFKRLRVKLLPDDDPGADDAEALQGQEPIKDGDLSKVISSLSRCQDRVLPSPSRNVTRA